MQADEFVSNSEKPSSQSVIEVPTPQKPATSKPVTSWLLVILVILLLGTTGFFAYKYYELKQQVGNLQPASSVSPVKVTTTNPSLTLSPKPTTDPTINWKSYSNSTHRISFKYPLEWSLTEKLGQMVEGITYNTEVVLSKGLARIIMYFNMDGIGGRPMELEGEPFVLDGNQLFQYHYDRSSTNSKIVGISSSLTSLGVFELDGVTYNLTLDYPMTYNEAEEQEVLGIFNQILSTFEFTN